MLGRGVARIGQGNKSCKSSFGELVSARCTLMSHTGTKQIPSVDYLGVNKQKTKTTVVGSDSRWFLELCLFHMYL